MIIETGIVLALVFGVLIVFHELGHFVVAKLVGIRVEEFALGFGPKLLTLFKKGDTEYTLHPLPLGGFVKLTGMEPNEVDVPDGFQAQPIWKRALVIFAGPFASFLLALLVFLGVGVYWGFPDPGRIENRVGMVNPQTEAAKVGLRAGDRILDINGTKITQGKQMIDLIHKMPGERVTLVVQRNSHTMTKVAYPRWVVEYMGASWSFMGGDGAAVDNVLDGSDAARAGIKPGDKLVSIDGIEIDGGRRMVEVIRANGSREASLALLRGGQTIRVKAKPSVLYVGFMGVKWVFPGGYVDAEGGVRSDSTAGRAGIKLYDQVVSINGIKIRNGEQMVKALSTVGKDDLTFALKRHGEDLTLHVRPGPSDYENLDTSLYEGIGLLGFQPLPHLAKAGFAESIRRGLTVTWNLAETVVRALTTKRITQDVGGPVMIARQTAANVALGPYWVITMLGSLSLSLAIINLIPIPVVDGGHLAILAIEAVRKKRLTQQQMAITTMVGIVILVMIVVAVLWSDIFKITQGLAPQ